MNYPTEEQFEAFLDELSELLKRHGMSLNITGYEYEADLVPGEIGNLQEEFEQAFLSGDRGDKGWDDYPGTHGPAVPYEMLDPMDKMMHNWTKQFIENWTRTNDLILGRPPKNPDGSVTFKIQNETDQ